jgi:hypothetical protein
MKITIGIDNGTTGSIGIIVQDEHKTEAMFMETPSKMSILGKKERHIRRIDHFLLRELITSLALLPSVTLKNGNQSAIIHAYIERPFTGRFMGAVLPAQRSFEAVLIILEQLSIPYTVVDSKEWQKSQLPEIKGSKELKAASCELGRAKWLDLAAMVLKHGDADGLLIADYYHNKVVLPATTDDH